jgi:hypothetical protein
MEEPTEPKLDPAQKHIELDKLKSLEDNIILYIQKSDQNNKSIFFSMLINYVLCYSDYPKSREELEKNKSGGFENQIQKYLIQLLTYYEKNTLLTDKEVSFTEIKIMLLSFYHKKISIISSVNDTPQQIKGPTIIKPLSATETVKPTSQATAGPAETKAGPPGQVKPAAVQPADSAKIAATVSNQSTIEEKIEAKIKALEAEVVADKTEIADLEARIALLPGDERIKEQIEASKARIAAIDAEIKKLLKKPEPKVQIKIEIATDPDEFSKEQRGGFKSFSELSESLSNMFK